MPFSRPTLTELRDQTAADINAALPGVDARLRYSNLGIIGEVLAGLASGHYEYADWIARQSVPFTATDEYLEGWAALKGVTRKPAVAAVGKASFTAAADGVRIPAGTVVNRNDGTSYTVVSSAASAAGTVVVSITAAVPGGAGNAVVGTQMKLQAGISGISVAGWVSAAVGGGADMEADDDLRSRMLSAYATPPQGGAITDYPSWALAVPGVTRAWVSPGAMGPGTLAILFMMDGAEAAHDGFPQGTNGCSSYEVRDTPATGDQLAVANAIYPRQSVTALVYAVAPTRNEITLTIAGLADADAGTRAAVSAAVKQALVADAVPGGRTNLSAIEAAIAAVAGTDGFVITAMSASAGTIAGGVGNILSATGAMPVLTGVAYA